MQFFVVLFIVGLSFEVSGLLQINLNKEKPSSQYNDKKEILKLSLLSNSGIGRKLELMLKNLSLCITATKVGQNERHFNARESDINCKRTRRALSSLLNIFKKIDLNSYGYGSNLEATTANVRDRKSKRFNTITIPATRQLQKSNEESQTQNIGLLAYTTCFIKSIGYFNRECGNELFKGKDTENRARYQTKFKKVTRAPEPMESDLSDKGDDDDGEDLTACFKKVYNDFLACTSGTRSKKSQESNSDEDDPTFRDKPNPSTKVDVFV